MAPKVKLADTVGGHLAQLRYLQHGGDIKDALGSLEIPNLTIDTVFDWAEFSMHRTREVAHDQFEFHARLAGAFAAAMILAVEMDRANRE